MHQLVLINEASINVYHLIRVEGWTQGNIIFCCNSSSAVSVQYELHYEWLQLLLSKNYREKAANVLLRDFTSMNKRKGEQKSEAKSQMVAKKLTKENSN